MPVLVLLLLVAVLIGIFVHVMIFENMKARGAVTALIVLGGLLAGALWLA